MGRYTSDLVYDSIIQSYGFEIDKLFTSRKKFELITKYLQPEYSVLDAGCANGLFSFAISNKVKEIAAIDINHGFLELAEKKAQQHGVNNIKFSFGDVQELFFPSNSFDLTYSLSVLVLVGDIKKAISELVRVTKPGGHLFLDLTGKYNLSQRFWRKWYASKGHYDFNALAWSEIVGICEVQNLEIIESHAMGFLDQWKYLPVVTHVASKLTFIEKILHPSQKTDIDYTFSNFKLVKPHANRWYIVCKKRS